MKRFLALVVLMALPSIALAGDIPGSNPGNPPNCTGTCFNADEGSVNPVTPEFGQSSENMEATVMRVLLDLFAAVI